MTLKRMDNVLIVVVVDDLEDVRAHPCDDADDQSFDATLQPG